MSFSEGILLIHTDRIYDYTLNQIFFERSLQLEKNQDHYLNVAGKHLGEKPIRERYSQDHIVIGWDKSPDCFYWWLGDTN